MAVDTQVKRQSAIATRRLPWFRRFAVPVPDSTIDQGDRQTGAFCYAGVLAEEPDTPSATSRPFYRPQTRDVADYRLGVVRVADTRVLSSDDQVQ